MKIRRCLNNTVALLAVSSDINLWLLKLDSTGVLAAEGWTFYRNASTFSSSAAHGRFKSNLSITSGWITPMTPTGFPFTMTWAQRPGKKVGFTNTKFRNWVRKCEKQKRPSSHLVETHAICTSTFPPAPPPSPSPSASPLSPLLLLPLPLLLLLLSPPPPLLSPLEVKALFQFLFLKDR